jgi:2-haloacid dehalogenase
MKNYKFLIFDLDDTLLDFQDTEKKSLEIIFKKYNIPFEEQSIINYKFINKNLWNQLEKGYISKEDVFSQRFEQFFKLYGHKVQGQTIEKEYRNYLNLGHKLIPSALESLTILKDQGYKIFAGTNGVGKTQRQRLNDSNLIYLFDDIFISEEIGFEKPNSEFFMAIFDKYTFMTKENTIMIGDSLSSDIQGAINFGIDSIWFNPSQQKASNIKSNYEIKDLSELLLILDKERGSNE